VKVSVFNLQKDLRIATRSVKAIIECVLSLEKAETDEVAIYFVSNRRMCQLHQQFFHDPSPTDCITFPMDQDAKRDKYHFLGEIFICPKTALNYSHKKNKNPWEETTLYLVHGLLHLLGYDDLEKSARRKMRQQENTCMKFLLKEGLCLPSPPQSLVPF
jgi:probable rRNA maturation factor